jgi:hypothetical protein
MIEHLTQANRIVMLRHRASPPPAARPSGSTG